jgi:exonuclease SbcC
VEGSAPAPLGELVLQNGRLSGARRSLTVPLTLIGQAPGCEVRLNIEGVNPLHCALLHGPAGFVLRDLDSVTGTRVNGQPVTMTLLRDGDRIEVGPFEFRVVLPTQEGSPVELAALEAERDALRIQAAAVVAQQAALTEEEMRLQQRRTALERQEEQLAAHLEQRRQHLLDLQEQVRQDRALLKTERAASLQEQEEVRNEVIQARQQAVKERRRLVELRKRLKRRWNRQWRAKETELQQREEQLLTAQEELREQADNLESERSNLAQAQLRFNGEIELGRRHQQDEWQQLGLAQQQWEECLNQEQTEQKRRIQGLEQREAAVAAGEQALIEEKRHWQQQHAVLQKEIAGLETRVRNQRHKLHEQEEQLARLETRAAILSAPASPPLPLALPLPAPNAPAGPEDGRPDGPVEVQRLANDLADQRLHLLEQWQGLLQMHEHWQRERESLLLQIEAAGQALAEREQQVHVRERELAAGAEELRQRSEALTQLRYYLEGCQARLRLREADWESERGRFLAEVGEREETAAAWVRRLEALRRRWILRRRQEVDALRTARRRCEEVRLQYETLWQDCQQRQAQLAQCQRALAGQTIALERFRQECLTRSSNSPAAEKRLERLRRRNLARIEADERQLAEERSALLAETARLEERAALLRQEEEEFLARQEEWMRQVADWEQRQAEEQDAGERREQEMHRLRLQQAHDQHRLNELRDEVERIARLLLDEGDAVPLPQAA